MTTSLPARPPRGHLSHLSHKQRADLKAARALFDSLDTHTLRTVHKMLGDLWARRREAEVAHKRASPGSGFDMDDLAVERGAHRVMAGASVPTPRELRAYARAAAALLTALEGR